jgi:uncharacterized SAM-binding protein YcdF (DUF218 family)
MRRHSRDREARQSTITDMLNACASLSMRTALALRRREPGVLIEDEPTRLKRLHISPRPFASRPALRRRGIWSDDGIRRKCTAIDTKAPAVMAHPEESAASIGRSFLTLDSNPMPPELCRSRSIGAGILTGALLGGLAAYLLGQLGLARLLPPSLWIPTLVPAGLAAGIVSGVVRRNTFLAYVDAVLLACFLIIGYSSLVPHLAGAWVRNDLLPAAGQAVVVLSSSVQSDTALDQPGLDRLLTGMELISQHRARRIVTSRVAVPFAAGRLSTDADQRRTIRLIDSTVQWSVVDSVHSTRDEAVHMARLLFPVGIRSIYLVTSPMHTRRACITFETVGFTVACHPALEHGHPAWRPETAEDRLESFRQYIYERLGVLKYRSKRWAP